MKDEELVKTFELNVIVLSAHRNREIKLQPDPQNPDKQTKQVTIWNRTLEFKEGVHLYESAKGDLRVVKIISKDKLSKSNISELDVLGQVSRIMELQKKSLFVQFHGWYTAENYVYLAMEYCVFGDIKKCFTHPLSEAKSRSICEQLLEGLVLLHDMGIAHRDIKPENVLVVQKDPVRIKLADFDISKWAVKGQTELRTEGRGTRGYMAPEAWGIVDDTQEYSTYTNAVDMWSLGCLLYFLLTKEEPFLEYSFLGDYTKGSASFPISPLIDHAVSDQAQHIIISLLAPLPEDRPKASVDLITNWTVFGENDDVHNYSSTYEAPEIATSSVIRAAEDSSVPNAPLHTSRGQAAPGDRSRNPNYRAQPKIGEEMSFYSYELWHVLKSTKTKSASTEQVVSILDQNGNPNVLHEGYNALHFAAEHGSVESVKVLLEYGANVNSVTEPRHENALHLATWQSDLDDFLRKLQILQQSHIDLNAQNNDGDTVLHLAIRRFGSVKAIEALLDAGASTERKDTKGRTPLWYAVFLKQEEKALKLLERGADVNCQNETGHTLLHLAIASNRISSQLIQHLISANIDVNRIDHNGNTPLFDAVKLGDRNKIRLLRSHGAKCKLNEPADQRNSAHVNIWQSVSNALSSVFD